MFKIEGPFYRGKTVLLFDENTRFNEAGNETPRVNNKQVQTD